MVPALAAGLLPYRWLALGLAFLALLAALGVQTLRLADARADLAEEQAGTAKILKAYADRARLAVAKLSDQQAVHAAKQQEIVHAYHQEKQAHVAAESGRATADQRLRDAIRVYAAGRSDRPGPDAAACRAERDRSATLGLLLEDAVGFSGRLAQAADQHASEVRFLKQVIENDRAGCKPLGPD